MLPPLFQVSPSQLRALEQAQNVGKDVSEKHFTIVVWLLCQRFCSRNLVKLQPHDRAPLEIPSLYYTTDEKELGLIPPISGAISRPALLHLTVAKWAPRRQKKSGKWG